MQNNKRSSGILFHITSLPGKYGIGDFGNEAYTFVDQLEKTGVKLWQTLPLGPTGYGNSPYSSRSTFAGNELLISIDRLIEDSYLSIEDLKFIPKFSDKKVEYNKVEQWKKPLLFKAAKNFIKVNKEENEYKEFILNNKWIDDYCLFISIYEEYNDSRWDSIWDEKLKNRDKDSLEKKRIEHKDRIELYKVLQYLFFKQWFALKKYTNEKGIQIIGDIPIFVARDSVDAWTNRSLFKTDAQGDFSFVSGCPPDGFTPLGQLWGTPVYDWESCERSGFKWWISRMKHQLNLCDILRIDHFRGFESYWEVSESATNAINGVWTKGPGKKLFKAIKQALGDTPLIAEDLGYMTDEVIKLRTDLNLPGMKIGVFGFSFDSNNLIDITNTDLPQNYGENFFAYPGTHDNTTIQQWFSSLTTAQKDSVCEYLATDYNNIHNALIRTIYHSNANNVVVMIADLMGLSAEGRMNTPSTCNDINWSWRLDRSIDLELAKLSRLIKYSHRD